MAEPKNTTPTFHPIAAIFPLLEGAALDALSADIKARGLVEPVWLYEGQVLDGRNRVRACAVAGVPIRTREFTGTPNEAIAHVWSLNFSRRHLSPSQAALADARRNQIAETYAPIREAAKARQAATSSAAPRNEKGQVQPVTQFIASPEKRGERTTEAIRAKAAGTNRTYINVADKLVAEHPAKAEQVERGEKTIAQVTREIRREEILTKTPAAPTGKYRVLYCDPPWKYGDSGIISKDGITEAYTKAETHYPTMSIAELCALPIRDIAEPDAVLWLWTTSPLLAEAFEVVKAWGFTYKASMIWNKVRHNVGHYVSVRHELLLICTRGSCLPDVPTLFPSVQTIERTKEHSEKPEEFRTIIDTIYPRGGRIELFARRAAPNGWAIWGNQA